MSLNQTILASGSHITPNGNNPTVTYSFASESDVIGVQPVQFSTALSSAITVSSSPAGLVVPVRIRRPGVFTAGTAQEGTLSNPNNDSNN